MAKKYTKQQPQTKKLLSIVRKLDGIFGVSLPMKEGTTFIREYPPTKKDTFPQREDLTNG